jgi:hypothetical protein
MATRVSLVNFIGPIVLERDSSYVPQTNLLFFVGYPGAWNKLVGSRPKITLLLGATDKLVCPCILPLTQIASSLPKGEHHSDYRDASAVREQLARTNKFVRGTWIKTDLYLPGGTGYRQCEFSKSMEQQVRLWQQVNEKGMP